MGDETQTSKQKELIKNFLEKDILVSPDFLQESAGLTEETVRQIVQRSQDQDITIVGKEIQSVLNSSPPDFDWTEFDKSKALYQREKNKETYYQFVKHLKERLTETEMRRQKHQESPVEVVFSYKEESNKRDIQDFVSMFNQRYKYLEKLLRARQELTDATSIARVLSKKNRSEVTVIGIVKDIRTTKNHNLLLTLEDPTGETNVLVNKNKQHLYQVARDVVQDEVVGVVGGNGDKIIFANNLLSPDVPYNPEIKKGPREEYAVFMGDPHHGSKHFLREQFENFLQWINGNYGNQAQKDIASKVKYLFLVGDIVDGAGVYPGQEEDLDIRDIYAQYRQFADYLKQVPDSITIIICPGNHDALRMSEPQPCLDQGFAQPIWELPNTVLVSNPSYVKIGATENFSGFLVLLYHGYSFPFYADNMESIRQKGGLERVDLIMRALLKKRHLAPTQTSSLYIPEPNYDPLLITHIPDFFVTGHIHRASATNYKNITLLNSSSWIGMTEYQGKMGLKPQPARIPAVNLKTRQVKILKF